MSLDCDEENNYTVTQHAPFGYYQVFPGIARTIIYNTII